MDRFSTLLSFYRDEIGPNSSEPLVEVRLLPDQRLHGSCLLNITEVSITGHVTASSRETRVEDFFDLFVGITLPSSSLAEFEIRQYHDLFSSLLDKEDENRLNLNDAIKKICETTAVDQLGSLPHLRTLCEDLGASTYDFDLYHEGLSKYEKLLEALPSEVPITDSAPNLPHPHALKLPLEVLMEIFHLCMTDFPRPDPRSPPFSLSQTCSVWRNLAIRLPELWTSMTLEIGGKCRSQSGNFIKRNLGNADCALAAVMRAWLPRAQSRSLSWRMIVHSSISDILMYILTTYGPSIQLLDIYGCSEPNGIFFGGRPHFPNLETLSVSCLRPANPAYHSQRLRYQAPRLKRLTWNIRNTPDSSFTYDAKWINITHLNLLQTMLLPDEAYFILIACKNLEYAAIELAPFFTTIGAIRMTTIVHTKLRSLFLRASSESMDLFPNFEFTALEKWHYAATNQDSMVPETRDLFPFKTARHVTLANIFLSHHLYERLHPFNSHLRTLDIYLSQDEGMLASFFRSLGEVSRPKEIFLLRLRNLILHRCDDKFPVTDFLDMVRNRASCETDDICRLESASLHFLRPFRTYMDVKSVMDNDEIEGFTFSLHADEMFFHSYTVYHFPILDW